MGTFNLTITYPDAQQTRILDGLKAYWTTRDEAGLPTVPTTPQVIELVRQAVMSQIKNIVLSIEKDAAKKASVDTITEITVT